MWFSAKTTVRYSIAERAHSSAVEERIVLLVARDFDQALAAAEAEARAYAQSINWVNADGLRVNEEYLGCCDVFQIEGALEDHAEIYSVTILDRSGDDARRTVERFFGPARLEDVSAELSAFEPDFEKTVSARAPKG